MEAAIEPTPANSSRQKKKIWMIKFFILGTPFAKMFNRFIVPPDALSANNARNVRNKYQVFDEPIQE